MAGYRMDRITEDVRREVSDIIRGIKDPRMSGLVSVVRAEVTSDLSYSKIYVSTVGGDLEQTVKVLNSATGFVRHALSGRLHIRKTPEIRFVADHSIEKSAHIEELLNEISKDDEGGRNG